MIQSGKKIYLCNPNLEIITVLNGVKTETVEYSEHTKDFDTLTFEVDEYIIADGERVKSNGYELLDVYMNLYLEDIGCFQIQHPSINNDGAHESKSITAYSLEREFMDKDFVGLKINTGDADSQEQFAEGNLNELGLAKEFITFYRPDQKDLSLLHIILEKMPGWSVSDDDIDHDLWPVKLSFDEDNINLYGLLTSSIAPKAECIFLFDTVNRKIKAIGKKKLNSYRYETNVFIGFRNLVQSIGIEVNEDTVYTRFNCTGADNLTFNNWNYNDSRIFDLSYFKHEPYMSNELVTKVNTWEKWRNDNRKLFVELSKQRAEVEEKITELRYKVPNDADSYKQWDEMNEEGLQKNLDYYNALLTTMQVSVDPNPLYETLEDGTKKYISWKKTDGKVDHDQYMQLLKEQNAGYYTYFEILNYIIPNIEIAQYNFDKVGDKNKKDYIKAYETNWDLYGIEELEGKKKVYQNIIEDLKEDYSKEWSDMPKEEQGKWAGIQANYESKHKEYVEAKTNLGEEATPGTLLYKLKELKSQLDVLQNQLKSIDSERSDMVKQATIDNSAFGFTAKDKIILHTLFHDTDYQNSNILTTSIDTAVSTIDKEKELYDDCVSKLSEVCQPQMTFSVDLDNLLNLDEFKRWEDDFTLLRFIRLGIRDDYSVRLRIVGRSWNPCDITPNVTVEFSNMITSRSGRSDLTDLLDSENNRGSKNSLSFGDGNSKNEKAFMTNLLQALISTGLFKNGVGNAVNQLSDKIVANLMDGYLNLHKIDVDNLNCDKGSFNNLFAKYIDTDVITSNVNITEVLQAGSILTDDINSATGNFTKYLTGVRILGDLIEAHTLIADKIIIRGTDASGNLGNSLIYALNHSGNVEATGIPKEELDNYQLDGKVIVAESITADKISVNDLFVTGCQRIGEGIIFRQDGTALIPDLTALAAKIAGWTIGQDKTRGYIYYGTGSSSGVLGAKGADNMYLGTDGISFSDMLVYDVSKETLTIKGNGEFSGKITAGEGKIGPWNINSTSIWKGNSNYGNTSGIYLGDNGLSLGDKLKYDNANLTIKGTIYATNGEFSGKITANSGEIAGWTITDDKLYKDTTDYSVRLAPGIDTYKNVLTIKDKANNTWPLIFRATGEAIMEKATISGGKIGGFTISGSDLTVTKTLAGSGNHTAKFTLSATGNYGNMIEIYNDSLKETVFSADYLGEVRVKDLITGTILSASGVFTSGMGVTGASNFNGQVFLGSGTGIHSYCTATSWQGGSQGGKSIINQYTCNGWNPWLYVRGKDGAWNQGVYLNDGYYRITYTSDTTMASQNSVTYSWTFRPDGTFHVPKLKCSSIVGTDLNDQTGFRFRSGTGWAANSAQVDNTTALGESSLRWTRVYAASATISTSDENEKNVLSGITEPYEALFMDLKPILYMWKQFENETHTHDRIHCGLGAQSVLASARKYGLDEKTVAAICRDDLDEPTIDGRTERWGIAYSELHGLEIHMIQKNTITLEEHNQKIQELEQTFTKRIEILENKLNQLEQASA